MTAGYFGPLQQVRWTVKKDGTVQLDYDYEYHGIVELVGVSFDYPEDHMEQVRWLGKGPYRVWQNRLHGTTLDVWENEYNDPVPGNLLYIPNLKGILTNGDGRFSVRQKERSGCGTRTRAVISGCTPRETEEMRCSIPYRKPELPCLMLFPRYVTR